MANIKLTLAIGPYDHVRDLVDDLQFAFEAI